ncbi:MAG: peptidylprolyl isomerase, partial [Bacteroidota bacterium]
MSALSRIRENIGLVAIIIFVALAAFVLTDFFVGISGFINAVPPAAEVAGQPIDYNDYQRRVGDQGGNTPPTELGKNTLENQIFQQMVSEAILQGEYDKLGIETTSDELLEMMAGQHIPLEFQQQVLERNGVDPNNSDQIKQFLQFVQQQQPDLIQRYEEYLTTFRSRERYLNMVSKAYVGSIAAAQQQFGEQNRTVDISYLNVPYTSIPDSTVIVTTADIADYISDHPKQFEQQEETYLRYVSFLITPSAADSAKVKGRLERKKKAFAASPNDSIYVSTQRGSAPYFENYIPISSVSSTVQDSIVGATPGTVFGPVLERGVYKLFKLVGKENAEDSGTKINHILIVPKGSNQSDTTDARNTAAGLARQARGGSDFGQLAKDNSGDPVSAQKGGALGWYNRGQFGEDFDEAVDNASVGSIVGPIKGPGGFHVVEVVSRTNEAYDMAEIEASINFGTDTRSRYSKDANKFAALVANKGNIDSAAVEAGYRVNPSSGLNAESINISGLNGGRKIVVWALNAEVGDASKVMTVDQDKYVVAQVTQKLEEGLKSADDPLTRAQVQGIVTREKKAQMIMDKLASMQGQDLNAMQTAYGAGATVGNAANVSFSAASVQ